MQRLIDANAVKENHKRWIGYLDDDMIARMNFAIDHHVPTVLIIPDNPTNGDMIRTMFPKWKIIEHELAFRIYPYGNDSAYFFFDKKWWDTPYKGGYKWQ